MEEFWKALINELWNNKIGISLAIVGIVLSFVNLNKSRPLYAIRQIEVSKVLHPKMQILFENEQIENFNILRWNLCNSGKKIILNEEIPLNDKLRPRIVFDSSCKILDIKSYSVINNQVLENNLRFENNILYIDFEYLKKNDGLCGEIFFSQTHDSSIELVGSFKNDDLNIQRGEDENLSNIERFLITFTPFLAVMMTSQMTYDFLPVLTLQNIITLAIFALMYFFALYLVIFSIPKIISIWTKIIPKIFITFLNTGRFEG